LLVGWSNSHIFSCWQMKEGFNAQKNATFGYHMQKLQRVKVFWELRVNVLESFVQHRYKLILETYTKVMMLVLDEVQFWPFGCIQLLTLSSN